LSAAPRTSHLAATKSAKSLDLSIEREYRSSVKMARAENLATVDKLRYFDGNA